MNEWISLPELMQRRNTSLIENVFEMIRAGLPVYERKPPEYPSKPSWAGGGKESQIVQLATAEERQKPENGRVYPHNVLFLIADVEVFEQAQERAGQQAGIVYDTPQNKLAKMCEVDPRTVSNWTTKGLLCEERGKEKLYSLPLTAEWLEKNYKRNALKSLNNSK